MHTHHTALAACCGFDLCHKYILHLYVMCLQDKNAAIATPEMYLTHGL
jgi:hypothetical protein